MATLLHLIADALRHQVTTSLPRGERIARLVFPAPDERRRLRQMFSLARSVVRPALAAVAVVAISWFLDLTLRGGGPVVDDPNRINTVVALLTTVIGFLGVATLAISISLTLVDALMTRYLAHIAEPLVEDQDRDHLLKLLFSAFVVTLLNICLLALRQIGAVTGIIGPVLFAILTFALLVGYTISRIRFFDPRHLAEFFVSHLRQTRKASLAAVSGDPRFPAHDVVIAQLETAKSYSRLVALCRANVESGRGSDAIHIYLSLLETVAEHARVRLAVSGLISGPARAPKFIDPTIVADRPSSDPARYVLDDRAAGPGRVRRADDNRAAFWLEVMALQLLPSLLVVANRVPDAEFAEAWFAYGFSQDGGLLATVADGDLAMGELLLAMTENLSALDLTAYAQAKVMTLVSDVALAARTVDPTLGIDPAYAEAVLLRCAMRATDLLAGGGSIDSLADDLRNDSHFAPLFAAVMAQTIGQPGQ